MHAHEDSGRHEEKPIVVFVGRSNVGKSSIIRALTGKRVRVGKRAGSTRWMFPLDMGTTSFVDLPGFGYMAGRSKTDIEKTKTAIVRFLEEQEERIALGILVLDASLFKEIVERWEKRGEIPIDIEFYSFLDEIAPEVIVVANKIDKVKGRDIEATVQYIASRLYEAVPHRTLQLVTTSATKKLGIKELRYRINRSLALEGIRPPNWPE